MTGRRAVVRRSKPKTGRIILAAVSVVMVIAVVALGFALGPRILNKLNGPADFPGNGSGEVVVRIESGDTGTDVANTLLDADVIASVQAFTDALAAKPDAQLQPGTYALASEMRASSALAALLDPANRIEARVTIPEGTMITQVYGLLSAATGIDEADFVQAASDPSPYGLPAGSIALEGWLFPATYTFDDGITAQQILQTMVDRMKQALTGAGIAEDQWLRTVTFASLVQREAGPAENFPKVARVFQNRLDIGMLLQSDATVAYGTGNTHVVTTTQAERDDADNPYNTYQHRGLPIGPIGAPGDAAIDAVLHPADGDWLYFVTVNLETGETVFSNTYAEHEVAVAQFQAWYREHPEYAER